MIGEECALEFFSKDLSHEAKAKDSTLKANAKTKDFRIVLEDPRGRALVLEDSNTGRLITVRLRNVNIELNVLVKRRILYTFTQ